MATVRKTHVVFGEEEGQPPALSQQSAQVPDARFAVRVALFPQALQLTAAEAEDPLGPFPGTLCGAGLPQKRGRHVADATAPVQGQRRAHELTGGWQDGKRYSEGEGEPSTQECRNIVAALISACLLCR